MSDFLIGIDPDIERNGIAGYDTKTKTFETLCVLDFWTTIEYLSLNVELYNKRLKVFISAGWLIKKTMWHKPHENQNIQNKIAMSVGLNHAAGRLIAEYCKKSNINYELIEPTGKVNAEYFKKLTKYENRTNQDVRDAGMLVFGRI